MYQEFFDLKGRPFRFSLSPTRFFPAVEHQRALVRLERFSEQAQPIALLVGPAGLGKTLLAHRLVENLPRGVTAVMLTNLHAPSVRALLQAIAHHCWLPYHGIDEQELRLRLSEFLLSRLHQGGRTLLVIDEAQHLTDAQLEEIRLLTNLEDKHQRALQVLLVGQPKIAERLARRELDSFRQRVGTSVFLSTFADEETVEYVRWQVAGVDGSADSIFTANALSEICQHSQGLPRRINQLCDFVLGLAAELDLGTIDEAEVIRAAEQLQFYHMPTAPPPVRRPVEHDPLFESSITARVEKPKARSKRPDMLQDEPFPTSPNGWEDSQADDQYENDADADSPRDYDIDSARDQALRALAETQSKPTHPPQPRPSTHASDLEQPIVVEVGAGCDDETSIPSLVVEEPEPEERPRKNAS